jgi:hypothetical protein|tara:strand:+ start:37 stop:417 length:381 start_codon:yes stop_codon:yes gene_type:complete
MKFVSYYSYKYPESVDEAFDSGILSLNNEFAKWAKYGIVIGSDKDSKRKFEGTYTNVALFKFTGKRVPNYIVNRVFSIKPDFERTDLDGYGIIPIRKLTLPFPMPMVQGGYVNQEYWPMLMEKVGL